MCRTTLPVVLLVVLLLSQPPSWGADPCGERGEYHTFVFDGPPFRRPVPFTLGEVHRHEPFAFQELFPATLEGQVAAQASC
jgi:diphthamide synthase (EF-2-diphthine--ammonia ligase)